MLAPNFNTIRSSMGNEFRTGWRPRYLDRRDYSEWSPEIKPYLDKMGVPIGEVEVLPPAIDLSPMFPSIKNQGNLGSCTANAASYVVEYYQNRAFGKSIASSRLFIYKVTRNIQREVGDVGAYLRTTMAALALCGVPPESYYPYKTADFDNEPNQFIYSIADNYEATCYFCHDPMAAKLPGTTVLNRVKKFVNAGIPSMFGFYICPSYESGRNANSSVVHEGYIPYPGDDESIESGHAVVVAGYDDSLQIVNTMTGTTTTGALKIINSWSQLWGFSGYGWLPYKYVETGLADDFWSIISMRWLDTDRFGL
jgi:C1A family cysteine protease